MQFLGIEERILLELCKKLYYKTGNPSETDHENIVNSKELKITGKNIPLSSHLRAVQLTRSLPHGKILRNRPAA